MQSHVCGINIGTSEFANPSTGFVSDGCWSLHCKNVHSSWSAIWYQYWHFMRTIHTPLVSKTHAVSSNTENSNAVNEHEFSLWKYNFNTLLVCSLDTLHQACSIYQASKAVLTKDKRPVTLAWPLRALCVYLWASSPAEKRKRGCGRRGQAGLVK